MLVVPVGVVTGAVLVLVAVVVGAVSVAVVVGAVAALVVVVDGEEAAQAGRPIDFHRWKPPVPAELRSGLEACAAADGPLWRTPPLPRTVLPVVADDDGASAVAGGAAARRWLRRWATAGLMPRGRGTPAAPNFPAPMPNATPAPAIATRTETIAVLGKAR